MDQKFVNALEKYVAAVQETSDTDAAKNYPELIKIGQQNKYASIQGKKWAKVIVTEPQRSVFCFVDPANGNIYKPAGWDAPAKGKRGNIYDTDRPLRKGALYRYK